MGSAGIGRGSGRRQRQSDRRRNQRRVDAVRTPVNGAHLDYWQAVEGLLACSSWLFVLRAS